MFFRLFFPSSIESSPESHEAFSCHVFLVSFNLEPFLFLLLSSSSLTHFWRMQSSYFTVSAEILYMILFFLSYSSVSFLPPSHPPSSSSLSVSSIYPSSRIDLKIIVWCNGLLSLSATYLLLCSNCARFGHGSPFKLPYMSFWHAWLFLLSFSYFQVQ